MAFGNTLDLTTVSGYNTISGQGKATLQFTDITISGTLILPSGTVLRATGNVNVTSTGTIIVASGSFQFSMRDPAPALRWLVR